jgi:hypothetical protein
MDLYGSGFEPPRELDFPDSSAPAPKLTQPPAQRVSGLFPGVKRPGRGRDSSVGRASRYGLDGPAANIQTGPGTHLASYTTGTTSFPGVKRPGRGVDHPPHLAPKLRKEYSYTSTPPLEFRGLF